MQRVLILREWVVRRGEVSNDEGVTSFSWRGPTLSSMAAVAVGDICIFLHANKMKRRQTRPDDVQRFVSIPS